jgi:hypothetical protein
MEITMSRMMSTGVLTAAIAGAATIGYVTGASAQRSVTYAPVLTGDNIGFQRTGKLERDPNGFSQDSITGVLVVRVDGKWVRARLQSDPPGLRPASE